MVVIVGIHSEIQEMLASFWRSRSFCWEQIIGLKNADEENVDKYPIIQSKQHDRSGFVMCVCVCVCVV